jgi:hypothetical protein
MSINFKKAINVSYNYMRDLLFKPFQLRLWIMLAIAAFLAGFSQTSLYNTGGGYEKTTYNQMTAFVNQYWQLIIIVFAVLAILSIVLLWLSSGFKFVYTDMIVKKKDKIGESFRDYIDSGTSYFKWIIVFYLALLILIIASGMLIFLGVIIYNNIYFKITSIASGVFLLVVILILASIIEMFAQNFVVTVMYAERIPVISAWKKVIAIIKNNIGQSLLYILANIVIAILVAIYYMAALIASVFIMIIPAGILALFGFLIYNSFANHVFFIIYVSFFGLLTLIAWLIVLSGLMQPATVFQRCFAIDILSQFDKTYDLLSNHYDAPNPIPPMEDGDLILPEHE